MELFLIPVLKENRSFRKVILRLNLKIIHYYSGLFVAYENQMRIYFSVQSWFLLWLLFKKDITLRTLNPLFNFAIFTCKFSQLSQPTRWQSLVFLSCFCLDCFLLNCLTILNGQNYYVICLYLEQRATVKYSKTLH